MTDAEAREAREALIAILSTAASMGIDIDLLCHRSVAQLEATENFGQKRPSTAGPIYQIGVCMNYALDSPLWLRKPA